MNTLQYRTIADEITGELEEKKSRFIATIRHVSSEEEALNFINEMKKKYWDARHNCSAYIIYDENKEGPERETKHVSDDGEPSRTAGMPMLSVLEGAGLKNVCAVVTRYFGGILLGTGGLVRAYQGAVAEALKDVAFITRKPMNKAVVTADYTDYGKLQYIATQKEVTIAQTDFTQDVTITCYIDPKRYEEFLEAVTEATAGAILIDEMGIEPVSITEE